MKILLVHGVFMHPVVMSLLGSRLKRSGHEVKSFGYSMRPTHDEIGSQFVQAVDRFSPDAIVGHSMGGVIALRSLPFFAQPVRSVVCLGSPVLGSAIARKVAKSRLSFVFSQATKEILSRGCAEVVPGVLVGMIAGTRRSFGFNLVLPVFSRSHEHDGTVAVHETKSKFVSDHITLEVGHTSMLFSQEVFQRVVDFIEMETFDD